jgi:hypothetical protein
MMAFWLERARWVGRVGRASCSCSKTLGEDFLTLTYQVITD